MTILLPRLPGPAAERLLDAMLAADELRWHGYQPDPHPDGVRFAATGGTTISAPRLHDLRSSLAELATANGFGDGGRGRHAEFDAALAEWISAHPEFRSGEALRDDVWSYIGVVMAPDIVHWRFGRSRERYLGGVRNTFQRVWLRARSLDRGERSDDRWGLLRELGEDALVAITERPAIGADPILARELAEGWVRAVSRFGKNQMEPIMRLATLRLRIRNEIQCLSILGPSDLAATVDEFFDRAAEALGRDQIESATSSTEPETEENTSSSDASSSTRRSRFAIWRAR